MEFSMRRQFSNNHLPVLDGLRFFAAFTVILSHYTNWVIIDQGVTNHLSFILGPLSGLGMPLFFVLSGFVIHYNYHHLLTQRNGIKKYLISRFARLYPLYIAILIIEFVTSFHFNRGSTAYAGSRWGMFLALPYYITLTQDWLYGVIGRNNLIYQYYMATGVAWSISLEFFFYLSYLFFFRRVNQLKNISIQVMLIIILHAIVIIYLLVCNHFSNFIDKVALVSFGPYATMQQGYQDSLLRWLLYFCPWVNLPAFIFGVLTANIYLLQKNKSLSKFEEKFGGWLIILSTMSIILVYSAFYLYLSYFYSFIGKTASVLYAPLFVPVIYCFVRYRESIFSKWISCRLFVQLGGASYSIYLLHAFLGRCPRDYYYLGLDPWILYVISIISVLSISRLSYLFYEIPLQRLVRNKLMAKFDEQIYGPIREIPEPVRS
jgi:peptidoglycan/LPS O-acetylase OafA/YrhL